MKPLFIVSILALISILVFFPNILNLGSIVFGTYAITEDYNVVGNGNFNSVSVWQKTGWVVDDTCQRTVTNRGVRYDGCEKLPQSYEKILTVCSQDEMENGALKFYYKYSYPIVSGCTGSRCDFQAQLYTKDKNGEYVSLGVTERTYSGSSHLNEKNYFSHSTGNIADIVTGKCIDIYLGRYWWQGYDGVSAEIEINKISINYDKKTEEIKNEQKEEPEEVSKTDGGTIPTATEPNQTKEETGILYKINAWIDNIVNSIMGIFK